MIPRHAPAVFGLLFALAISVSVGRAQGSASAGSIEGRVFNARSGEYLEKARVTAEGTGVEALTDASGTYRLGALPPGSVRVRVFFTGFEPLVETVPVTAGATALRDFTFGAPSGGDVVRLSEFVVGAAREMDGAAIAINEQRFAPNITHVVSAGEFGISADGSVGEFLKFMPGISVDYVGGTANTISMDGVPSNNVPVTVGGFDLASTSSASTSRSTELLQISIHNAARLEVTHSPTPESPASALAGGVNIVPRSAFERAKPLFVSSVYLLMRDNYRALEETPGPRRGGSYKAQPGFDFSFIVPVNKRFGFTLSGSYSNQFIPEDRITNAWRGAGAATTGLAAATAATQYPDTTPDRPYLTDIVIIDNLKFNQRSSFGTTLDFKISSADTLSFSYQYGAFSSANNGSTLTLAVNHVQPGNFTPTATRGTAGRGQLTLASGSRWREGETHMPTLVYRHRGSVWQAEAGAGYSHSTNFLRDVSAGYLGAMTVRRTNVTLGFDDIFYLRPRTIAVTDGTSGAVVDPYSLATYNLVSVGSPNPRDSIDVKRSAYANARREFTPFGIPVAVKGGLDVRQAVRDMRGLSATFNYSGAALSAGGFRDPEMSPRALPYGLGRLEWLEPEAGLGFYRANLPLFTSNLNDEYRSAISLSKRVEEMTSSGYLRGDVSLLNRRLKLVGGVRFEQTNIEAEGPLTDVTLNYQRNAAGKVILGPTGAPLRIRTDALGISQLTFLDRGMHAEKEYFRVFPNLNVSFNLRDNLIARASSYTSIGRPDYNQYAGGLTLPDIDDPAATGQRITVNNVAIKPWSAQTTKVRLEYYFEGVGQVAIGAFRREFENFFTATIGPASPEFLALYNLDPDLYGRFDVSTQRNLDTTVRMSGLEAEYKQALTFLPAWARGVQVFANLTALRATGESAAEFRGYIPRTYNWGLSVSRPRYILRANWNYQGRRRLEAITGRSIEAGTFQWRQKRLNLDLQGEYKLSQRFTVFANLRNVGVATEDFERTGPSTPAHAQFRERQDFGSSWTFGVKGTF
jgi:iron complex outermembrane receptor protein